MLTYDPESALVLLHDARSALLVDVTLCIDADALLSVSDAPGHRWALERKGYVWVIGHLDRVEVSPTTRRWSFGLLISLGPAAYPHAPGLLSTARHRPLTCPACGDRDACKGPPYCRAARCSGGDGGGPSDALSRLRRWAEGWLIRLDGIGIGLACPN